MAWLQGLEAGMHKQVFYTGLRLGLYEQLVGGDEDASVMWKVACATGTTSLGIAIANPADVVQTKFIAYRTKAISCPSCRPAAPAGQAAGNAAPVCAFEAGSAAASRHKATTAQPTLGSRHYSTHASHASMHAHSGVWQRSIASGQAHKRCYSCARPGFAAATSAAQRGQLMHNHAALPGPLRQAARQQRPAWHAVRHASGPCAASAAAEAASHTAAAAQESALVCLKHQGPRTVTGVPLRSARAAYFVLIREEGVLNGLYRGFWANLACNSSQGAAEIATYDVAKHAALAAGHADGWPVHLAAGAPNEHDSAHVGCMSAVLQCQYLTLLSQTFLSQLIHGPRQQCKATVPWTCRLDGGTGSHSCEQPF